MGSRISCCSGGLPLWFLVCYCLGVGVTDAWWGRRPEFGPAAETVMVEEGETAKLPCVVLHLNDKSVTWLRRRDLHILTAGHHTYSADQRFQMVHAEGSEEWTLVVRYAQLRDAGVYECQVNSEPKLSRHVTLKVHDPRQVVTKTKVFVANNTASTKNGDLRVQIQGPRELYIEEGSSLSLVCVVTSSQGPSTLVYWYHDTSLIDYNSPRGGVNLKIDRGRGETTTRLVVSSVGPGDSGMYSCVPQGSHPATVLVHVQKGEHEAAIQQGGLSTASSTSPSPHLPLFSSLLLLLLLPSINDTHLLLLFFNSCFPWIITVLTFIHFPSVHLIFLLHFCLSLLVTMDFPRPSTSSCFPPRLLALTTTSWSSSSTSATVCLISSSPSSQIVQSSTSPSSSSPSSNSSSSLARTEEASCQSSL